MFAFSRTSVSLLACATVVGCGSPGSGTMTYQEMFDLAEDTGGLFDQANALTEVQGAAVPTTGTADYVGLLRADWAGSNLIYGEMSMTVDMSTTTGGVTGTVDNLRDATDTVWTGSLAITDGTPGTIDRGADPTSPGVNVFHANIAGTLVAPSGNHTFAGPLMGNVHGTQQEFLSGATGSADGATVVDATSTTHPIVIEWVTEAQ